MERFLAGLALGTIAGLIAAIWLAVLWSVLIGLFVAAIVWFRWYGWIEDIDVPNPLD